MSVLLKANETIEVNVYGTAAIVGIAYLNGDNHLTPLGELELLNFETITIKPYDYCYVGGIENAHIKKKGVY